jgi:uncharacterized iron-regulated protein
MFIKSIISAVLMLGLANCTSTEQKSTSLPSSSSLMAMANIAPLTSLYSFQVINSASKLPVSVQQLAAGLKYTDVVFMGEFHSHQGSHLLQLQLLEALFKQNPNVILSMEQFTRDNQPVLDKYLAGEYGEATLIEDAEAWPHYKGSYRAIIEFAREHNIPVVAANSPAMHVRCVGKKGAEIITRFPAEQADWSARELDLENESYKDKFLSFIQSSGRSHGQTPEQQQARQMKTYAAQLLRDTTMAESIANAMAKRPGVKVVHLNGAFHSDSHLGTTAVLENMRPTLKIKVLSPVMVEDNKKPIATAAQYKQGDYIYLLREMPERFYNKDKRNASIRKLIAKRMTETCDIS